MNTTKQTSQEYFKLMQIIYFALITGQIIFAIISFYLSNTGNFDFSTKELDKIFIYIVLIFVVGGFSGSTLFFRYKLSRIKNKTSLIEKMTEYRSALIIRYALLETPSFFSLIAYLLTGNILFLGLSAIIILFFLTIKPTKNRTIFELKLNVNERQTINNNNAIISNIK